MSDRHQDGRKKVDSCSTQLALLGIIVTALVRIYRKGK